METAIWCSGAKLYLYLQKTVCKFTNKLALIPTITNIYIFSVFTVNCIPIKKAFQFIKI